MDRVVRDPEEEAPLVPINDWRARVLSRIAPLPARRTTLDGAWGCVLAADVRATTDLPGFTSSAMDGFAVRAADMASASLERPVDLHISGEVRMGHAPTASVGAGEAVVVPTGGVVPPGADAVVPVELCAVEGDVVRVLRVL